MDFRGRLGHSKYDPIDYHPSMNLSRTSSLPFEDRYHTPEIIIIHKLVIRVRDQAGKDIPIRCT